MAPLILTVKIDDDKSFQYFNELRTLHFPPERNFIDAHVTLFHHLPNDEATLRAIDSIAAGVSPFQIEVSGVMLLGNGVAFRLSSDLLSNLRARLRSVFEASLTKQDLQKFNPHITVQNKVSASEAKTLYQQLMDADYPKAITAQGLCLFEYLGGPWRSIHDVAFASQH